MIIEQNTWLRFLHSNTKKGSLIDSHITCCVYLVEVVHSVETPGLSARVCLGPVTCAAAHRPAVAINQSDPIQHSLQRDWPIPKKGSSPDRKVGPVHRMVHEETWRGEAQCRSASLQFKDHVANDQHIYGETVFCSLCVVCNILVFNCLHHH